MEGLKIELQERFKTFLESETFSNFFEKEVERTLKNQEKYEDTKEEDGKINITWLSEEKLEERAEEETARKILQEFKFPILLEY